MALELEIDEREVVDTRKSDGAKHQHHIDHPSWHQRNTTAPTVETMVLEHDIGKDEQRQEDPKLGIDVELLPHSKLAESTHKHGLDVRQVGGPEKHPSERHQEECQNIP